MRSWRAVLLPIVVASLALAGCGSSSKPKQAATSTSTSSAATTTSAAPAQDATADKAKATPLLLKQGDFPAGWTGTPHDSSNDTSDEVFGKQFAGCLGIDASTFVPDEPTVDSPDFKDANDREVDDSLSIS